MAPGVTTVEFHLGYMSPVDLPALLRTYLTDDLDESSVTYYLADRKFTNRSCGEITGVTERVFTFMHRNSATASRYFGLPDERVVTLATQLDL